MSDDRAPDPLSGARTPPGAGDSRDLDAELRAAAAAIVGRIEAGDGDQLDLIDGSPDFDALDPISMTANLVAKQRRGPGRPKGSRNRRNSDIADYLATLGHRDPLVTLSMIQTANTSALADLLGADRVKVLAVQAKAAADLAQYMYAKQVKLETENKHLHLFVSGVGSGGATVDGKAGLSIFGDAENINEINGDAVRDSGDASHAGAKAQSDQGVKPD